MIIFGIDPGQTGAIAVLHNGHIEQVIDMPTAARLHGKGLQVDAYIRISEDYQPKLEIGRAHV